MKIQVELTHEIIDTLSIEQAKIILKQLTTELKSDVDSRIEKIKTELAEESNLLIDRHAKKGESDTQVVKSTPQKQNVVECGVDVAAQSCATTKKVEFNHPFQLIPNSVMAEIQKRYDEGERSLMMLLKEDYPQYNYNTVYPHIKLKKKSKK